MYELLIYTYAYMIYAHEYKLRKYEDHMIYTYELYDVHVILCDKHLRIFDAYEEFIWYSKRVQLEKQGNVFQRNNEKSEIDMLKVQHLFHWSGMGQSEYRW